MSVEDFVMRVLRDIARRGGVFAYRWWRRLLLLWVLGMAGTSVWNAFSPWSEFNRGLIYDPGAEVLLMLVAEIEVSGFFSLLGYLLFHLFCSLDHPAAFFLPCSSFCFLLRTLVGYWPFSSYFYSRFLTFLFLLVKERRLTREQKIQTSFPTLPLHLHTIFHVLSITLFAIITFFILWNLWTLLSYLFSTLYHYLSLAYTIVYIPVALVVNVVCFVVRLVAIFAFIPLAMLWFVAAVLWSGVLKEGLRVFLFGDGVEGVEVKCLCGVEEEFGDKDTCGGVEDEEGDADANGGDEWQYTDTDYESSDENEEEQSKEPSQTSQGVGKEEVERPSTPPNQMGAESEKVDSVMRGQMEQRGAGSTGRDEGASPKARSGYTRES